MARRKQDKLPKNDFAVEDDLDVCGFSSEPITAGECISSFSFDDNSINEIKSHIATNTENKNDIGTSSTIANDTVNFPIDFDNVQILRSSATSNNNSTANTNNKFINTKISNN